MQYLTLNTGAKIPMVGFGVFRVPDKQECENSVYEALRNINLTVRKGEFICIIGSSGCGKSTLLSVLSGLNKPSSGSVRVNGAEIDGAGEERAVGTAQHGLVGHGLRHLRHGGGREDEEQKEE